MVDLLCFEEDDGKVGFTLLRNGVKVDIIWLWDVNYDNLTWLGDDPHAAPLNRPSARSCKSSSSSLGKNPRRSYPKQPNISIQGSRNAGRQLAPMGYMRRLFADHLSHQPSSVTITPAVAQRSLFIQSKHHHTLVLAGEAPFSIIATYTSLINLQGYIPVNLLSKNQIQPSGFNREIDTDKKRKRRRRCVLEAYRRNTPRRVYFITSG